MTMTPGTSCLCSFSAPGKDREIGWDPDWVWLDEDHAFYYTGVAGRELDFHGGLIMRHRKANDQWCEGAMSWWDYPNRPGHNHQLISEEPLTVAPSLLCHCGEHGFIQEGKWKPA